MAKHNTHKEDSLKQLKNYVKNAPYIEVSEQRKICKSFGLPYRADIFRDIYRNRVYEYLKEHTTTMATVEKETGIPHKYLTEVKAYYEKRELLKVVYLDICPTTTSKNVQFVSTNPDNWNFKPVSNQTRLF